MREVFYGVTSQGVAPYFFDMEEMYCSFFGHREIEITEELVDSLTREIDNAVANGYSNFYFGGYGEFDALCYKAVTEAKNKYPERNICRIYCVPREQYLWRDVRYFNREDYDKVVYLIPPFDGWYKSIYYRNCAMIDNSDMVIFYADEREGSGAYKAYKYALRKKKSIVNLFKGPANTF